MTKEKKKYAVFWCPTVGDAGYSFGRELMGETTAVSEAQAINQVRYRTKDKPKGMYISPGWSSGGHWEAEEVQP